MTSEDKILLKKIKRVKSDIESMKKSLDYAFSQGDDLSKYLYRHSDGRITDTDITMRERLMYLEKKLAFWETIYF